MKRKAELITDKGILTLKVPADYFDEIYDAMDYCFLEKGDPKLEVAEIEDYFVFTIEETVSTTRYMKRLYELINEA